MLYVRTKIFRQQENFPTEQNLVREIVPRPPTCHKIKQKILARLSARLAVRDGDVVTVVDVDVM